MLKIIGSYTIPGIDANFGFYYSFMDGERCNKNIMIPNDIDPDPVAAWSEVVYIYAEEKGSYKYPARHNLDLRLEKFFVFGKYRVGAMVDLFNALNSDTVTEVETRVDPWSDFPFGYVWGIRSPRTFRASFRFEF